MAPAAESVTKLLDDLVLEDPIRYWSSVKMSLMASLSLNCLNDLAADKLAGPIPSVTIIMMFFFLSVSTSGRVSLWVEKKHKYAMIDMVMILRKYDKFLLVLDFFLFKHDNESPPSNASVSLAKPMLLCVDKKLKEKE